MCCLQTKTDRTLSSHLILAKHGWSGSSKYYAPCIDVLGEDEVTSSSIRQVIVVDIRGHGRSAFTGSAKVEDLAKDLREIIEEVKPTNLTCIGSSMG